MWPPDYSRSHGDDPKYVTINELKFTHTHTRICVCILSRFTWRRLPTKKHLEEEKWDIPNSLITKCLRCRLCPLGSKGNYLWHDFLYKGNFPFPFLKISPGTNDSSAAPKTLPILCPRWHGFECWSGVSLNNHHIAYQLTSSCNKIRMNGEFLTWRRATGDSQPSLHTEAWLMYLGYLWQTFIHCVWRILLHFPCPWLLLAFSILNNYQNLFFSVKFLKKLNQHDLLFFPIPTRLFLSPVVCK